MREEIAGCDAVVVREKGAEDAAVVQEVGGVGCRGGGAANGEALVVDRIEGADEEVVDLRQVGGAVEGRVGARDVWGDGVGVGGCDKGVVLVEVGWAGDGGREGEFLGGGDWGPGPLGGGDGGGGCVGAGAGVCG